MSKLDKLKKEYDSIEIPPELESVVNDAVRRSKEKSPKRPVFRNWMIGTAAAAAIFVGSINVSPSFAQAMGNVPFLGSIVQVLTVHEIVFKEERFSANLATPTITGLADEELQASLNEKYLAENKALFDEFQEEMKDMEEFGGGHLGVDTGYEVKTDTERILSIGRYYVNTVGSSSTTFTYDTIDKIDNVLITLPSLFKDELYIPVISAYIETEIERQMKADENIVYFTEEDFGEGFTTIEADQQFYITDAGKLVISFDKYEIAPGYMGMITFEIPTEVVTDLLVSDVYIK
ncbi:DUF3298 domain-containing protein [Sporosarcina sp. Sa2YVA2]|uniref:DUF3298 domain-containing protein n=1 Tax=Sporosarcina quadrami TaxID=2762234 RepID=A0ABR8U7Z7_9BACL|nr:anti-sigma-V factor rsiV [Sporosarcina quadrami]MBD7983854.1 DUF3298 domain-containing protein [Sporosarcina quadrami]